MRFNVRYLDFKRLVTFVVTPMLVVKTQKEILKYGMYRGEVTTNEVSRAIFKETLKKGSVQVILLTSLDFDGVYCGPSQMTHTYTLCVTHRRHVSCRVYQLTNELTVSVKPGAETVMGRGLGCDG